MRWVEVIGMDRGVLDKMVEVVVMGSVLRLVIGIGVVWMIVITVYNEILLG